MKLLQDETLPKLPQPQPQRCLPAPRLRPSQQKPAEDTKQQKYCQAIVVPSSQLVAPSQECTQATLPYSDASFQPQTEMSDPVSDVPWGRLLGYVNRDLIAEEYCIGRNQTCDIRIDRMQLSSLHCRIFRTRDGSVYLQDVSSNGTHVNGALVGKGNQILDQIDVLRNCMSIFYHDMEAARARRKDAKHPEEISDYYITNQELGSGTYGTVRKAVIKHNGAQLACKIIDLHKFTSPRTHTHIQQEVKILMEIHHPNVVRIVDFVFGSPRIYIFLELLTGGDLFEYITKKGRLPEKEVKFMLYQLVHALQYLHSMGICHRDVKPENVLLESDREKYSRVCLTDFGLAKSLNLGFHTFCGTISYTAPEVLQHQKYTKTVDMWSLGVTMYAMMTGMLPFDASLEEEASQVHKNPNVREDANQHHHHHAELTHQQQLELVKKGYRDFPHYWNGTKSALKMVTDLMTMDPEQRITAEEALKHGWFREDPLLPQMYQDRIVGPWMNKPMWNDGPDIPENDAKKEQEQEQMTYADVQLLEGDIGSAYPKMKRPRTMYPC